MNSSKLYMSRNKIFLHSTNISTSQNILPIAVISRLFPTEVRFVALQAFLHISLTVKLHPRWTIENVRVRHILRNNFQPNRQEKLETKEVEFNHEFIFSIAKHNFIR